MKLNTKEQLSQVFLNAREILEQQKVNIQEEEFTIVQPYDNGDVIILGVVEENGKRTIKQTITDNYFLLPKKDGVLDIFIDAEESGASE